jgi:TP901 family phage tail tape measure protein
MADEVVIKFTGDAGSLLGATRSISGEVKTLGDLFTKLQNQGKTAYLESAKGATQLANTLGTSFKNAKQFAESLGLSAAAANQAAQRLGELDRAGAKTAEKYRALRAEFGLTRQAFESLNGSFNQNTKSQTQLAQTLGVSIGAARNLANDLGLSASKANEAVGRYRELSSVGATLAEKQRVLTQELGLSATQFENVRKVSLATREGLTAIAGVAGGVAAALGAIGGKGIQIFAEFDKEIRAFTVTSKATPAQVAALTDNLEQLAISTGKMPQELATAATELARTGFTAEQVQASIGGIANASIATNEQLGRTGEVFASTVTQFKLGSKDFDKVSDILVTGANASAGGINSIGEGLKFVGTSAKSANQSATETVRALSILSNVGLGGTVGGTALDEFLRRISLTSAQASTDLTELQTKGGKKAVAAFKLIGASVRDAKGELLPMSVLIPKLRENLASLDSGDKSLVLNQIFGVQGSRAALGLIEATGDVVAKVDEEFGNLEGAAKRTGAALNQGPAAAMKQVQASTTIALNSIGGFLSQGFLPLINLSGLLLNTFNSLPAPLQGAVVAIGSVAAALAGATAAIAAYKLSQADQIVTQAIAAAGLIKETVLNGFATVAKNEHTKSIIAQALALRGNAVALNQVSIGTAASIAGTKAMAVAQGVVSAATAAWAFVTSGALVPALASAGAATGGFLVSMLAFLPAIVAVAGALALLQEVTRKTEQEKFRDDIDKSTEAVRKLRGEVATPPAGGDLFDSLGASYDKFGKRLQERGFIGAIQATIVDLSAALGIGADAAAKFGDQWALITREQLGAQQATFALERRLAESAKVSGEAAATLNKFGLATLDAGDKTRLGAKGIADYNAAAATQTKAIDAEIESLKKLSASANDPQAKASLDTQISALESNKRALAARSAALAADGTAQDANKTKVKTGTAAIEEQKKALDELKKSISAIGENAEIGAIDATTAEAELNKIAEANKTNLAGRKAVKDEILKIRQSEIGEVDKLLKQGELSEAESIQRLAAIQSGTGDKAAKQSASDAIVKIKQDQINAEIELNKAGIAAIEAQVANGTKNAGEAEKEITALKLAEIDKRIAAAKLEAEAATTDSAKKKGTAAVKTLEAEKLKVQGESVKKIAEAQAKAAEEERQATIDAFDTKLKILEAGYQKGETSEADYLAKKQQLQTQQSDEELKQLNEQLSKLGAEDVKGRSKISAKIAEVELKRVDIQKAAQKAQIDALKESQDKALAIVQESEQQRLIEIQQSVNAGVLTEEKANQLRSDATRQRLAAELEATRKNQAELEAISTTGLGKDAAEQLEGAKRDARQKTTQLTLQLLQQEEAAQKAARDAVIKGIQTELAAKVRGFDAQLSKIKDVQAAQARSTAAAEAAAQREAAAFEQAANALQRQTNLLGARANLQSAQNGLAQTETTIAADRAKQALALRTQLDQQNLSQVERVAIEKELARLGFSGRTNTLTILRQEQALQAKLSEQKRTALIQEQETARSVLALETQRNQIAAARTVTEARINELKAQQAILTAQQALQEQRIADARAIAEAQAALSSAKAGTDREAIAAAQAQVRLTQDAAKRNQAAAVQGVDLATQQAELAKQSTAEAIASNQAQTELEAIAAQTLTVQQQQATAQLEAAIAAERQAAALTLARAQAEAIGAANGGGTPIGPGRFTGGPIGPGKIWPLAEKGPEMVRWQGGKTTLVENPGLYRTQVPGHVYTADQTRRMMAGSVPSGAGSAPPPKRDRVVDELQKTRKAIEARKAPEMNVTVASGDSREMDKLTRSLIRARF